MIFKNKHEARKWFLKYKPLTENVISFCYEYDSKNWGFGDWILFHHITNEQNYDGDSCSTSNELVISRPILAVFTNFKIWDQALVINFIQPERAWMYSHQVITNPENNYSMHIMSLDDEVEAIQFWTDNIKVLGHWKQKPSIKDLRLALSDSTPETNFTAKMEDEGDEASVI